MCLPVDYPKTNRFDQALLRRGMMGPNALKMLEELMEKAPLAPGARVLDLGCGMGLTSLMLRKEYGAEVFAADLWISASENYARFAAQGCARGIVPLRADANDLPFADGYFDAVVSVDSYHYFGAVKGFFSQKTLPLLRRGGVAALAFPGVRRELDALPEEMRLSWADAEEEILSTFHSPEWWRALLTPECEGCDLAVGELEGFEECWADWLGTDNSYAIGDRRAMEAGAGRYMDLVYVVVKKR